MTTANVPFYSLNSLFSLLWKAPAHLLLPELQGTRMMGILGCLCPPNTYLLSWDRTLPTLLIPVFNCSVTWVKWEQNNSLEQTFHASSPCPDTTGLIGFFPINLWKQPNSSKPRELWESFPALSCLSSSFPPAAPPLFPQNLHEASKSVPKDKCFGKGERRSWRKENSRHPD